MPPAKPPPANKAEAWSLTSKPRASGSCAPTMAEGISSSTSPGRLGHRPSSGHPRALRTGHGPHREDGGKQPAHPPARGSRGRGITAIIGRLHKVSRTDTLAGLVYSHVRQPIR